jgi:hypothetical protein
MKARWILLLGSLALASPALAQQSAHYRLSESSLNGGGHPAEGVALASTAFRMRVDVVGQGLVAVGSSSMSLRADQGFAAAYPMPGEARGLRFDDRQTLRWDAERSAGTYDLYRDAIESLSAGAGSCRASGIRTAEFVDAEEPPAVDGFFYLVTAENRLGDEGSKGNDAWGDPRPNPSPCP